MAAIRLSETLRILPTDRVRQVMWRTSNRRSHQLLVQSTRAVAHGPVARLVAAGARRSDEWTPGKPALLELLHRAGLTTLYLHPEHGGRIDGPKNLALALVAFELAWVDTGAAASVMATHLALTPIYERGTPEQRASYLERTLPATPSEERARRRGAVALADPYPWANAGRLGGRMRVADWREGHEPTLLVEKRGRSVTNMEFADFISVAVDSDGEGVRGSCMVILEETDPGTFDRGTPTRPIVRQLPSTSAPILSVTVPASRIVGGYTVQDGAIVPRYSHAEVIEAVLRRTHVARGLMPAARLLSAIEPVLRHQRTRVGGGDSLAGGSPVFELGFQPREDALDRLVDLWATGEASASFGFATARLFDELDGMAHRSEARAKNTAEAADSVKDSPLSQTRRGENEFCALESNENTRSVLLNSLANVMDLAVRLWNTGQGAAMMREAISLVDGFGMTEDCPGFLGYKCTDAQFEADWGEPEAAQRRRLSIAMTNEAFITQFRQWIGEMRAIADERPGTGACSIATAMQLWLWTLDHLRQSVPSSGSTIYQGNRPEVTLPLADALCWLLAARFQILDVLELDAHAHRSELAADERGCVVLLSDLCHVQAAHSAGEVGRICAGLVYGYTRHPSWDDSDASCCRAADIDELEGLIPGISAATRALGDVIEADGSHVRKAGPCAEPNGLEPFQRLRSRLDKCLAGAQLAKDRAAAALTNVMIPEAPDYPA